MSDNPVTKLDQVGYRYLLKQSPDTKLDQVQYRYLIKDNNPDPLAYDKTPHEYLLQALKNGMYLPVKEKYISFTNPTTLLDNNNFNATVDLNVVRESGFKGSKTLYYNRQVINDLVRDRPVYEDFKPNLSQVETTGDMLDQFNSQFGTVVPRSEIEDVEIDFDEEVKLTASNESFFWQPGTIVSFGDFSNTDKYWDLELGTFIIPQATHNRLTTVSNEVTRYTPALAAAYNSRRI